MRAPRTNRKRLATALAALALALGGCDSFKSSDALVARADEAAARGDFVNSVLDLRKALEKEPGKTSIVHKIARNLVLLGDPQGAQDLLAKSQRSGSADDEYVDIMADAYLALGKPDQLLKEIESNRLPAQGVRRAVLRGRALSNMRRWSQAHDEFEQALATEPRNVTALVGVATCLAAEGDLEGAQKALAPIVSGPGAPADARLLQGVILAQRGRYAEAEQVFVRERTDIGKTLPLTELARLLIATADAQLAQGNVDAAAETHKSLIAFASQAVLTRMLGARIALARGNYPEGIAELQRVVTSAPTFLQARMLLGTSHLAAGNLYQAAQQLQQVVAMAPDNVEARKLLARVSLALDRPGDALRTITPALQADNADAQLYSLLGAASALPGERVRALDILERTVKSKPTDVSLRLELAAAYLRAQRYADAIKTLKETDSTEQSGRRVSMLISALAASQGAVMARAEVDRQLADHPKDKEVRYVAVAYFIGQLELERARAEVRNLIQDDPKDVRAQIALASLERTAGNLPAAEEALRAGVQLAGNDSRLQLMLAKVLLLRQDWAHAREALDRAVVAAGGSAAVVNTAGLLLLDSQRYDEALARFRHAIDLNGTEPTYWFNAARAQVALNQPAAARESVNKAIEFRPDWSAAESLQVFLDLRTGGPDAALERAKGLRERRPRDPAVLALLGDVYFARKEYSAAADAFEAAEQLEPDAPLAVKLYEAQRLANTERPERALTRWLARRPDDVRVRLVLAEFYMGTDRNDRALEELEAIVRQNPNSVVALNNLAWLYLERSDRRATATAERAYSLAPKVAAVADTYGWILLSQRRGKEALPVLESAARSAASDATIQYHYASALAQAGRESEARVLLQRVIGSIKNIDQRRDAEKLLASLRG